MSGNVVVGFNFLELRTSNAETAPATPGYAQTCGHKNGDNSFEKQLKISVGTGLITLVAGQTGIEPEPLI